MQRVRTNKQTKRSKSHHNRNKTVNNKSTQQQTTKSISTSNTTIKHSKSTTKPLHSNSNHLPNATNQHNNTLNSFNTATTNPTLHTQSTHTIMTKPHTKHLVNHTKAKVNVNQSNIPTIEITENSPLYSTMQMMISQSIQSTHLSQMQHIGGNMHHTTIIPRHAFSTLNQPTQSGASTTVNNNNTQQKSSSNNIQPPQDVSQFDSAMDELYQQDKFDSILAKVMDSTAATTTTFINNNTTPSQQSNINVNRNKNRTNDDSTTQADDSFDDDNAHQRVNVVKIKLDDGVVVGNEVARADVDINNNSNNNDDNDQYVSFETLMATRQRNAQTQHDVVEKPKLTPFGSTQKLDDKDDPIFAHYVPEATNKIITDYDKIDLTKPTQGFGSKNDIFAEFESLKSLKTQSQHLNGPGSINQQQHQDDINYSSARSTNTKLSPQEMKRKLLEEAQKQQSLLYSASTTPATTTKSAAAQSDNTSSSPLSFIKSKLTQINDQIETAELKSLHHSDETIAKTKQFMKNQDDFDARMKQLSQMKQQSHHAASSSTATATQTGTSSSSTTTTTTSMPISPSNPGENTPLGKVTQLLTKNVTPAPLKPNLKAQKKEGYMASEVESFSGSFARTMGIAAFFTTIAAVTARLCKWQIDRRVWKIALLAQREDAIFQDPLALEDLTSLATDIIESLSMYNQRHLPAPPYPIHYNDATTALIGSHDTTTTAAAVTTTAEIESDQNTINSAQIQKQPPTLETIMGEFEKLAQRRGALGPNDPLPTDVLQTPSVRQHLQVKLEEFYNFFRTDPILKDDSPLHNELMKYPPDLTGLSQDEKPPLTIRNVFGDDGGLYHAYRNFQAEFSSVIDDVANPKAIPLEEQLKHITVDDIINSIQFFKVKTQFHNVSIDGRYDYTHEMLVGPTVPPLDHTGFKNVEVQKGYYIVTPCQLYEPIQVNLPVCDQTGTHQVNLKIVLHSVLVNRGWLPQHLLPTYLASPLTEHELYSNEDLNILQRRIQYRHDSPGESEIPPIPFPHALPYNFKQWDHEDNLKSMNLVNELVQTKQIVLPQSSKDITIPTQLQDDSTVQHKIIIQSASANKPTVIIDQATANSGPKLTVVNNEGKVIDVKVNSSLNNDLDTNTNTSTATTDANASATNNDNNGWGSYFWGSSTASTPDTSSTAPITTKTTKEPTITPYSIEYDTDDSPLPLSKLHKSVVDADDMNTNATTSTTKTSPITKNRNILQLEPELVDLIATTWEKKLEEEVLASSHGVPLQEQIDANTAWVDDVNARIIYNEYSMNKPKLDKVGLTMNDVFKIDPSSTPPPSSSIHRLLPNTSSTNVNNYNNNNGQIGKNIQYYNPNEPFSLITTRKTPLDTPLLPIRGVLNYGATFDLYAQGDQQAKMSIRGVENQVAHTFLTAPKFAYEMGLSSATLHIPNVPNNILMTEDTLIPHGASGSKSQHLNNSNLDIASQYNGNNNNNNSDNDPGSLTVSLLSRDLTRHQNNASYHNNALLSLHLPIPVVDCQDPEPFRSGIVPLSVQQMSSGNSSNKIDPNQESLNDLIALMNTDLPNTMNKNNNNSNFSMDNNDQMMNTGAHNHFDTVRFSLKRKSVEDHLLFKTMPETHLGYALTWGSFSSFATWMTYLQLNRPIVKDRFKQMYQDAVYAFNSAKSSSGKVSTRKQQRTTLDNNNNNQKH